MLLATFGENSDFGVYILKYHLLDRMVADIKCTKIRSAICFEKHLIRVSKCANQAGVIKITSLRGRTRTIEIGNEMKRSYTEALSYSTQEDDGKFGQGGERTTTTKKDEPYVVSDIINATRDEMTRHGEVSAQKVFAARIVSGPGKIFKTSTVKVISHLYMR